MSRSLDDHKKEIRSILIPFQKGCFYPEFQRTYKELIGRRLPSAEFGFKNDIEFLYSMPDVVRITPYNADYHLQAVADEKVKHIQKMVMKQKPAKLKQPPPSRFSSLSPRTFSQNLPPRFSRRKTEYYVPERFQKEPLISQKTVPKEPLLTQRTVTVPKEPSLTQRTVPKVPLLPSPGAQDNANPKLGPKDEVILLVKNTKNKIALDDLLVEYKRMYNKTLSLSQYGFSSVTDCIESIPQLCIVRSNSVDFIVCSSELHDPDFEVTSNVNTDRTPTTEMTSRFNSGLANESCYEDKIPSSLRKKFQLVAERIPECVSASEFPDLFEQITSESLDILSLGYRCLSDLIDDVPDIFTRKPVVGSRKDYIIYPARSKVDSILFVDHIDMNIRKILEAYPEGIKIKDILHVYSINCKDALHIEDLGFDDLEAFLLSIQHSIPLTFGYIDGEKSVHLKLSSTAEDLCRESTTYKNENLPFNAVLPESLKFKRLSFPADFDYTKFVPVFVSAVAHPGHLYIQFQPRGEVTQGFEEMSKEMENFYHGRESEIYMMKRMHMKNGVSCVAKWPSDNHWYRAEILSISSPEVVKVLYVDYGTTDTIPTNLLRYVKKEFISLPVQAIKCRLAYVKPPKNAGKWDMSSRNRILNLCEDIPLMAKFEIGSDGIYSVVLCDTNGKDDVYINDILVEEGLAEYDLPEENNPVPPEQNIQIEANYNLNVLQALQAQYFLKAFAAIAPCFAQNEHYLILLQQVSSYCQAIDPVQQSSGFPLMPPVGPPGFNSLPPSLNANPLYNTYSMGASNLEGSSFKYRASAATAADHFIKAPIERDSLGFPKPTENEILQNGDADNEIFEDDDDEMFQQFCQKVSLSNVRYVKRVMLGDGYNIHIIVVESIPYASSGDISQLIWNNQEADYLFQRLQFKDVDIPSKSLSEDGNEELFKQLKGFNVKGLQSTTGFKSSILLFQLKYVIKLLNIFGHPSITLRKKLTEEITNFNPDDPYWQEFSPDAIEYADPDHIIGVTDDNKIERLCLYDLEVMKESITCKKKKVLNSRSGTQSDEIYKLETLQKKVLARIQEIKEICKEFT